jgi:hypothetical protein
MMNMLGCDLDRLVHMRGETPFQWVYGVSPVLAAVVLYALSFRMMILTLVQSQFVAVVSVQEGLEKTSLEGLYDRAVVDLGLMVTVPVAQ